MKLSIVILCWNDQKVIGDCLHSIYSGTGLSEFEVIVCDNCSSDGSVQMIRRDFPQARVVENHANLGFAKGNNAGIRLSYGEYILILNPDTIIHTESLDRWIDFADCHPRAGAFGCRVLNPDGSYQHPARPFPSICSLWMSALYAWPLGHLSRIFLAGEYVGWNGESERAIDWQSGCSLLVRGELLKGLGGFDEQFFYSYEEVDLCRRIWDAGYCILFAPEVCITHLGRQSVRRFPVKFVLEAYRSRYRYFYKHFGERGARRCRRASLAWLRIRQLGYGLLCALRPSESLHSLLQTYRVAIRWNTQLDPVRFVEQGEEPGVLLESVQPLCSLTRH